MTWNQPPSRRARRGGVLTGGIVGAAVVAVVATIVAVIAFGGDEGVTPPNGITGASSSAAVSRTQPPSSSAPYSSVPDSSAATPAAATEGPGPVTGPLAMMPTQDEFEAIVGGEEFEQTYDSDVPKEYPPVVQAECVATDYLVNGQGFDGAATYSRAWEGAGFLSVVAVVYPSAEAAAAAEQTIVAELGTCALGTVITAGDNPLVTWRVDSSFQPVAPYIWGMTELTDTDGSAVPTTWSCNYQIKFAGDRAAYSWYCGRQSAVTTVERLVDATLS